MKPHTRRSLRLSSLQYLHRAQFEKKTGFEVLTIPTRAGRKKNIRERERGRERAACRLCNRKRLSRRPSRSRQETMRPQQTEQDALSRGALVGHIQEQHTHRPRNASKTSTNPNKSATLTRDAVVSSSPAPLRSGYCRCPLPAIPIRRAGTPDAISSSCSALPCAVLSA